MAAFHFTDSIDISYHDALETLFYFNPQQFRYSSRIMEAIEHYGPPKIVHDRGKLTLGIETRPDSRCMAAFYGPKLVGVMMALPESETRMNILHMAVDEDCALHGDNGMLNLVPEMFHAFKQMDQSGQVNEYYIYYVQRSIRF